MQEQSKAGISTIKLLAVKDEYMEGTPVVDGLSNRLHARPTVRVSAPQVKSKPTQPSYARLTNVQLSVPLSGSACLGLGLPEWTS